MSDTPAPSPVHHNAAEKRYEITAAGETSVAEYERTGDTIIFTHTYVPPALRGRGLAEQLVRRALEDARAAGQKVVPQCSYVARFIDRHREFQPLLAH